MMLVGALWEPLTAIATLALAFVTAGLARSTRKLAREANAETRANWRPILHTRGRAGKRLQAQPQAILQARHNMLRFA